MQKISPSRLLHFVCPEFDPVEVSLLVAGKGKYIDMTPGQVLQQWEEVRERGTQIHLEIENFIQKKTSSVPSISAFPSLWEEFVRNQQIVQVDCESNVETNILKGIADCICYTADDRVLIIDWKTGALNSRCYENFRAPLQDFPYSSLQRAFLQVGLYQSMFPCKSEGFIFHFQDEGVTIHECPDQTDKLALCLGNEKFLEKVRSSYAH